MIRPRNGQEPLFYTATELPPPSPTSVYARLNAVVGDWRTLATPLAAAFSATTGRPTDPVVYLKIFLIGYFENIVYDTDLAERIDDSRALRHFLGYTLTDPTPDHSSISRVRQRLAAQDLTAVLDAVVAQCIAAGLVTGELAALDASLLRAHVSRDSFRPKTPGQSVAEHVTATTAANPLPLNARVASTTDPDARLKGKRGRPAIPSYQLTHVTDGAGQIILAATVTPADIDEADAALPALAQAQALLAAHGQSLQTVVADAGYDDARFHAAVDALPATPLTHLQPDGSPKPAAVRKKHFTYHAERDEYRCPQGHHLLYLCAEPPRARSRYVSNPADCAACPLRTLCLSPTGTRRWLSRSWYEDSREAVRARGQTAEGRTLLARRKAIVEGPFGHMKTYGGLGRLNCRGLAKVGVKALFAAVAWNLIRLSHQACSPLRKLVMSWATMPHPAQGVTA